jgi:hypothetical protein
LEIRAGLRNLGEEPWQGRVALDDALLPAPIVAAEPESARIAPGEEAEFVASAICLMRNRSGYFGVGLNPAAWTSAPIGETTVDVRLHADGRVREFLCPTLAERVRRPDWEQWQASVTDRPPDMPIILEFRLADPDTLDVLRVGDGADAPVLVAWRPELSEDAWVRKERASFLAFDGTGDFGPGGCTAAHEAVEGLLGLIPLGCSTALIAYDGAVKFDPDRLMPNLPARTEVLLDRLWRLECEEQASGQAAQLLGGALLPILGAEREASLFVFTGAQEPGDLSACEAALDGSDVRVGVLQVGRGRPAPALSSLCAGTGGVALAIPPAATAELGVVDLLANLAWPGIVQAGVQCDRPAAIVAGPGDFANQPILALVSGLPRSCVLSVSVPADDAELAWTPGEEPVPRFLDAGRRAGAAFRRRLGTPSGEGGAPIPAALTPAGVRSACVTRPRRLR